MSLDDIDKIARCVEEIRDMIPGATMTYDTAVGIERTLGAIVTLAARVKMAHAEDIKAQRDIIEGLMANWPHTEIEKFGVPVSDKPVLMKDEALRRGADLLKDM